MPHRLPWGTFPKLITHCGIADLQQHPAYADATRGDYRAARTVVRDNYRHTTFTNKPDFVVPVIGYDAARQWNAIPLAFAEALASDIGCKLVTSVLRSNIFYPTEHATTRILKQARFTGAVPRGTYLLVDDIVSFGSTIANLRSFVLAAGGKPLLATSLASGIFSSTLTPSPELIQRIKNRFYEHELNTITSALGFPLECLTHCEGNFINGLSTVDDFRAPTPQ